MGLLDDAIREHLELKRRRGADPADVSRQESEALGPVKRPPDGAPDLTAPAAPEARATEPERWEDEETALVEPPSRAPEHEPSGPYDHDLPAADYDPPPLPPEPGPSAIEPERESPSLLSRLRPTRKRDPEREPEDADDPPSAYDERPREAYEPPASPAYPPAPDDVEPARAYDEPEPDEYGTLRDDPELREAYDAPPDDDYEPPPPPPYEPPPLATAPASSSLPPTAPPGDQAHDPDIVAADDEPEDMLEETPEFLEETPEHDRLWFEQRPPRDFDFDD